ncbi:MAG: ExbD/TolR family protein [Paracoccaceae bacterium]
MADMSLKRRNRPRALISLVPMIDVMLILLVFFMVTSTYLNLDMIPAVRRADDAPPAASQPSEGGASVMIRITADGTPVLRGRPLAADALGSELARLLAEDPLTQVMILPSTVASTQSLITVMEAATNAGITRLRVVRLEAGQ